MHWYVWLTIWVIGVALGQMSGCAATRGASAQSAAQPVDQSLPDDASSPVKVSNVMTASATVAQTTTEPPDTPRDVQEVALSEFSLEDTPDAIPTSPVLDNEQVTLERVIESIYVSYPLLEGALYSRDIAAGEQLASRGQFDLKVKGSTENGPVGFYQTYRHAVGINQPVWNGGEVFAGYRLGSGTFQPWYQERQTNDGGEFKVGGSLPLLRNRSIDSRRANWYRADYGRQLAEPDIQAQLIGFIQEGSYAYWEWVAATRKLEIAQRILKLAEERTERIRRQVEEGLLDPPELTDNLRLIADRKAKLADAYRKERQTAIKLSLYLRDAAGSPLTIPEGMRSTFPEPEPLEAEQVETDVHSAWQNRPELLTLDLLRQQLGVDVSEAENDLLPNLDAALTGSQDIGLPTSKKQDKSPFELEAGLYAEVPVQRRKAKGKLTSLEGKLAQIDAKRRMTMDKIAVDVRNASVALDTAHQRVLETRQAVRLAEEMALRERRNEELGLADMLKVALREQYAVESAEKEVEALLQYHQAAADYRAALAFDHWE